MGESSAERIQTTARLLETRRTHITMVMPRCSAGGGCLDRRGGRLLRLSIPAQSVDVVREDIASVAARRVTISRANDEPVKIPANGFRSSARSQPANAAAKRLPAVVLVGGSGPTDRDETAFNIPIFGQLADALADAGYIVLRYDKRGVGQSGGRAEAATLADYADDLRAAVKFMSERKDVDPKRIAVLGHSEGGIGRDAGGGEGQAHRRARARGHDRRDRRRFESRAGDARARSEERRPTPSGSRRSTCRKGFRPRC